MIAALKQALSDIFGPQNTPSSTDDAHEMRLAAAALMVEVMRTDHETAEEEELRIIALIRDSYDLDERETQALIDLAHEEARAAVSLNTLTRRLTDNLETEDRARLVELLWDVAYADGRIDKYEEHLIRRIAELLYLPHAAFIRAKHRAAERSGAAPDES